jgi:hypothetical protein
MDNVVLVDNLEFTFVIINQRCEGLTDLLAVRSSKLKRIDDGYLGVLDADVGAIIRNCVDLTRLRPFARCPLSTSSASGSARSRSGTAGGAR